MDESMARGVTNVLTPPDSHDLDALGFDDDAPAISTRRPRSRATTMLGWVVAALVVIVAGALVLVFAPDSRTAGRGTVQLTARQRHLQALEKKYGADVAATAKVLSVSTATGLANRPTDPTVRLRALGELSGVSPDVAKYGRQLRTLQAISPDTLLKLISNPRDPRNEVAAAMEISKKLRISVIEAGARLIAISQLPGTATTKLSGDLAAVNAAEPRLDKLVAVSARDRLALTTLQH